MKEIENNIDSQNLIASWQQVSKQMTQACEHAARQADSVTLLAVSKTKPADMIATLAQQGQQHFGENYLQEAIEKIDTLKRQPETKGIIWHYIGSIQRNKTRDIAEHFDWVHTIDRLKIAERLSEQRPSHLATLQVCIQVNVDGGASKSGVPAPQALALAQSVAALPGLCVRGIMCIPDPAPDFIASCAVFTGARELFDTMRLAGLPLDTLSMGMSGDLEAAIASGSTMVRIGSAIFGERLLR